MGSKNTQGYMTRGGKLYVQGSIDGEFKRYSTGLEATKKNETYVKRNHMTILLEIHEKKTSKNTPKISTNFVEYGLRNLELNANRRTEVTNKEYFKIFNTRIAPHFKDYDLADIKRPDLSAWQKSLRDEGLSGKRINNVRTVFNFILEEAKKDEIIEKNYFSLIDREPVESQEICPFHLDEVKLLLSKADGWYKDLFQIAFFTGARTGELVMLKWDDINFVSNKIHIQRTIRKGVVKPPKNGKGRIIDMLPPVREALLRQKQRTYLKNSYVFMSSTGTHYRDFGFIRDRIWTRFLKLCGLDYRTLYQTRHTFATMMISKGEDIVWVSQMLGHADVSITLRVYTKWVPQQNVKRAAFLDDFSSSDENETKTAQMTAQNNLSYKKVS